MRPFVAAEIGKLCVGLEAHFAYERLHAAVYVHVLFEAGRGAELLAALVTRVRTTATVIVVSAVDAAVVGVCLLVAVIVAY
jgi:hypothetical protein